MNIRHIYHVVLGRICGLEKEFHSSGETVEVSAPIGQIPVFIRSETLVLQELQNEVQI